MSNIVSGRVWAMGPNDALSGNDRLVLLAIADNADDDGFAWPGVPRLAYKTGLSERTVKRIRQRLVAAGYLVKLGQIPDSVMDRYGSIRADRRPMLVQVVPDPEPRREPVGNPGETTPERGDKLSPRATNGVTPQTERGDTTGTNGVTPMSPEPSENHQRTPMAEPSGSRTPKQQARDRLFDALTAVDGIPPGSKVPRNQAAHYGKLVSQLAEIDATPEQVAASSRVYRRRHPSWECTAAAVVKHWAALQPRAPGRDSVSDDDWIEQALSAGRVG